MRLRPIIEHVSDLPFKTFGGALEFAALKDVPRGLPALYVIAEDKQAGPNRLSGAIDQRVEATFRAVLVLDAARRAGAVDVSDQLDELARAVTMKLLGWMHPDARTEVTYLGEGLMSVDGTALVWGIRFTNAYHLRKVG